MTPSFLSEAFDLSLLDRDGATLVAIDEHHTIRWFNQAWTKFARANDGKAVLERFSVGASYVDAIGAPLRDFYEAAFRTAVHSGKVFEHEYDCSSPELARVFHLRALPTRDRGLLIEHSLLVEQPLPPQEATPFQRTAYVGDNGLILQCANCRRVKRGDGSAWDWLPTFARRRDLDVSHGICPTCVAYYWR